MRCTPTALRALRRCMELEPPRVVSSLLTEWQHGAAHCRGRGPHGAAAPCSLGPAAQRPSGCSAEQRESLCDASVVGLATTTVERAWCSLQPVNRGETRRCTALQRCFFDGTSTGATTARSTTPPRSRRVRRGAWCLASALCCASIRRLQPRRTRCVEVHCCWQRARDC
jgi:hypothetical protein